ncbi:SoxR reducing system RseC family protein [Clostridium ihumii]|uniref:SoxR reducing system RseC family protein n=1 Tax=Clostridium ihumii TaxID=1470356 RepID=UPI000591140C|nr:SoxR reducing system RseC family protein [Clostridium ihumii]
MEQDGVVKKINGDTADIAFIKKSGCGGNCGSCKSPCPSDIIIIPVKNTLDAKVGDKIKISVGKEAFSNMTFWAYVFPTIMTLIGLIGSMFLFKSLNFKSYEVLSVVVGIIFLVISFLISSKLNKKAKDGSYNFKMIKKL